MNDKPVIETFHVKEESDWLVLGVRYEREHTWRAFHLYDPQGRIRSAHLDCYNGNTIIVHRDPASCSYLTVPGAVQAGEWRIAFTDGFEPAPETCSFTWAAGKGDLHADARLPAAERDYWADGSGSGNGSSEEAAHFRLNLYDPYSARSAGARWYKGDFHTHTVLSDGKMTPERNMAQAEIMGLDFFAATDHNLLSTSWPKGKALVIPGIEFTSDDGHWNALGLRKWIDWTARAADGGIGTQEGMNRVMAEASACDALVSVNHPMLEPWAWTYGETPLAAMDSLEIWNDPTYHSNPAATEKALKLWSALWNEGYRVTGIGGSDSHLLPTESYGEGNPPSLIGDPATYVYAEELSAAAILAAVKRGDAYVSRGPALDIAVRAGGQSHRLGSDLTAAVEASADGEVAFELTVAHAPEGAGVRVIENGEEIASHVVGGGSVTRLKLVCRWDAASYRWRRFELRGADGSLLAFTNPVSCGAAKAPAITTWKQLLDSAFVGSPAD